MVTLLSPSKCREIYDTSKLDNMSGEIITYCSYNRRRCELSFGMGLHTMQIQEKT